MSNAICQPRAGLSFLDRYLTLWICAAMAGGVLFERRFFARAAGVADAPSVIRASSS